MTAGNNEKKTVSFSSTFYLNFFAESMANRTYYIDCRRVVLDMDWVDAVGPFNFLIVFNLKF